jgi:hypothetical protein
MYHKPTISDLLALLDEATLDAVTQRLNQVLHDQTDHDKSQLLLEVLESWADAGPEDKVQDAEEILELINTETGHEHSV